MGSTKTAAKKKKSTVKSITKKPKNKPKPPVKQIADRKQIEKTQDIAKFSDGIDFCNVKLNAMQLAFLTHYLTPGSPSHGNASMAAREAGYSKITAIASIYRFMREPAIQKIIKANEGLAQQSLQEASKRAIELKQARAFYNPSDFFEQKEVEYENKYGTFTKSVVELKPLSEMSEMQQMCIDGVDVKGQASIPVYIMPNRDKALDDIIKLNKELYGSNTSGQDTEELREVIIERVTIRQAKRSSADREFQTRILDRPDGIGEEEL